MNSKSPVALLGCVLVMLLLRDSLSQSEVVEGTSGKKATLHCSTEIQGDWTSQWLDPRGSTLSNNYTVYDKKRFNIIEKYHREWHLDILEVKSEDRGNYTCRIFTNPLINRIVTLIVVEPPRFVNKTKDQELNTGSTLSLTCVFSGVPPPTITWFHHAYGGNGRRDLNFQGGTFVVPSVTKDDAGVYECDADNKKGTHWPANISVNVFFKPEISVPYREISQEQGSETLMTCLVTANPSERLYWTRDGVEMVDSSKYQTHVWRVGQYSNTLGVFIRDLSASDYGDYRCIAKNQFGQAEEKITIHEFLSRTPLDRDTQPSGLLLSRGSNPPRRSVAERINKATQTFASLI